MWARWIVWFTLLQSAAHLIRVRADAVEVSDSAQLEAALVNPGTTEILLFPSSRVNETAGNLTLTLEREDFDRVGPARISSGQSITIQPGIETGKTYINFNGIRPSIALEYNASLSFNRLVLDRGGNFSDPPSVVDVPAFIPELITTGTVIALPGASISFTNTVHITRKVDCLSYIQALVSSLVTAAGPAAVSTDGPVKVHFNGRHVNILPPNATSTQPRGLPVMVTLENMTWVCLPDPGSLLVPSLSPVYVTGNEGGSMAEGDSVVVSNSMELAAAIRNDSVSVAILSGSQQSMTLTVEQGDFTTPAEIRSGRRLTLLSGGAITLTQLDFSNLQSVILLRSNASLSFINLTLTNVAPPVVVDPASYPYPAARFLWAWPSVVAEPGASVGLANSVVNVYADCAEFRDVSVPEILLFYGTQSVLTPNNRTVTVLGLHTSRVPLQNVSTGLPIGEMEVVSENATAVCFDDLAAKRDLGFGRPPAMAPPRSTSSSGTPLAVILGVSLGLGLPAALLTLVLGLLIGRSRKRRRLRQGSVDADEASGRSPATSPEGEEFSKAGFDERFLSTQTGLTSPHAGALWQLRFLGSLEDEQVEIGPLLGQGGFGQVYKGRWKGAVVAIKVVQHRRGTRGLSAQQRMDRESLLSTSLSHPNIVTTYKITPVQSSSRQSTDTRPSPDHTPLENDGHQAPDRPAAGAFGAADEGGTASTTTTSSNDGRETWLIMEYCDRGSLLDAVRAGRLLKKDGTPDLLAMYKCLLDIATGMDYLHAAGIIHGDLKTANVLLKSTTSDMRGFVCKLADFGLSHILDPNTFTHVVTETHGTMAYMPPELLKDGYLSFATDVFSFAMVMWEVFCGNEPFTGMSLGQIFYKLAVKHERPPIPSNCPSDYADLMQRCWSVNLADRPSFAEIMEVLKKTWQAMRDVHDLKLARASQRQP